MDMTPQTWPEWYDGRHINEVLFCQQFLDKHPVLRPQLSVKILPAGGGREPQPGVYLRKLRQGVYNNEGRCQILR